MGRRTSTMCDSAKANPAAAGAADIGKACSENPMRREARLPWRAHSRVDRSADEIEAKARAAMSADREVEAAHWLVSPFDEDGYSTSFEPAAAMLTVLRAAVQIEPDPVETGSWYRSTCIAELGGLTAAQLVALGRADEVVGFLLSVRDGRRD
jgi:hypothetical protein